MPAHLATPIGNISITASNEGISKVWFVDDAPANLDKANELELQCQQQLQEYFDGKREAFDVPLDLQGTDFQRQVWQQLLKVPFGKTATYQELSRALNNEKAIRAVGAANGSNPIAIIVPCHRIIASDGKLTGYAGGLSRKEWLLNFENAWPQAQLFAAHSPAANQ